MATKTIAWGDSIGGNISLTYTGIGNGTISASSTTKNTGTAVRTKTLTVKTTKGSPQKSIKLTIRQAFGKFRLTIHVNA